MTDGITSAEMKATRESMGLSTRWLAKALGVAETTLQRWESSNPDYPPPPRLHEEMDEIRSRFDDSIALTAQKIKEDCFVIDQTGVTQIQALVIYVPDKDTSPVSPPEWPAEARRAIALAAAAQTGARVIYQ